MSPTLNKSAEEVEAELVELRAEFEAEGARKKNQKVIKKFIYALWALGLADVCDVGEEYATMWKEFHFIVGEIVILSGIDDE
jgi:hypothetical protein